MCKAHLATLMDMLRYCRPHGSQTENAFRAKYLHSLPGMTEDEYRNLHCTIGESSILWSCHTDTVHRAAGMQTIHYDAKDQTIRLSRKSTQSSSCLGADDTVGVFIMREMILAGVPGHYVFHYGEEAGCIGSSDLAHENPALLQGAKYAIALDRAGTKDIVTHQMGDRCTSDLFVSSLAYALTLASHGTLDYSGAQGVYTDTAEYIDLVHECSNLSVGYYRQHSREEWIDVAHVDSLLSALLVLDQSLLESGDYEKTPHKMWPILSSRDYEVPTVTETSWYRSRGLWRRDAWAEYEWCDDCDSPKIDEDDPNFLDVDHCICAGYECETSEDLDLLDENDPSMTDEDRKFLRYLKGLD